ncbi:hypothetical protein PoB_004208700 [Plakobranchus ocellatus]|uniref:Uncharacterized protein n=1 Tax=Plakobranchus ocellatus TaxID=259542 RepID=A0AAV4B8S1_9GAST|nr:hypothetical protein PoB_004208700 [Plakobranchus ocellatus]
MFIKQELYTFEFPFRLIFCVSPTLRSNLRNSLHDSCPVLVPLRSNLSNGLHDSRPVLVPLRPNLSNDLHDSCPVLVPLRPNLSNGLHDSCPVLVPLRPNLSNGLHDSCPVSVPLRPNLSNGSNDLRFNLSNGLDTCVSPTLYLISTVAYRTYVLCQSDLRSNLSKNLHGSCPVIVRP